MILTLHPLGAIQILYHGRLFMRKFPTPTEKEKPEHTHHESIPDAELHALALDLKAWLKNPPSKWMPDFFFDRDIPLSWIPSLSTRCPLLAKQVALARDWQNSILLKGGMTGSLNSNFVRWVLESDPDSDRKQIQNENANIQILNTMFANTSPHRVGEIGAWVKKE
jgi:hypothetical protein